MGADRREDSPSPPLDPDGPTRSDQLTDEDLAEIREALHYAVASSRRRGPTTPHSEDADA